MSWESPPPYFQGFDLTELGKNSFSNTYFEIKKSLKFNQKITFYAGKVL